MRIAVLNPWRRSAENQIFESLQLAGRAIGCELTHCVNSDEIEQARPDFVIALSSVQGKLTGYPTYGAIHEPRDRFLATPEYFRNLISYDGHLTLSESLREFLSVTLKEAGREPSIGYFYCTCQSNRLRSDEVEYALKSGNARLTYFGTNWDKRRRSLFKRLSDLDNVEIYGPEYAWRHIKRKSYKGELPFDGNGPQEKYARNALGLVILADKHLLDDVISNRIFEITSVGAIAICPRMPWIEKHYGDSVYYFNQFSPDAELVNELAGIIAEIQRNPDAALKRAREAHRIFTEKFSAERMLQNTCEYHLAQRSSKCEFQPLISVIARGENAHKSINAQTAGRFELITVESGPTRGEALWQALQKVTGDYFALLFENDEWMPNHIERLLPLADGRLAYSATVGITSAAKQGGDHTMERRCFIAHGDCRTVPFLEAPMFTTSCSFLAPTSLLREINQSPPAINSGEDALLILELIARAEPCFDQRATAIQDVADQPIAAEDAREIVRRVEKFAPAWNTIPDPAFARATANYQYFKALAARQNWPVHVAAAPVFQGALSPKAVRGKESAAQWATRALNRWQRSLRKRFPKLFPPIDDRPRLTSRTLA